jgi:hypothetical protein
MKYMLLITRGGWQDTASEQELGEIYGQIGAWFEKYFADGTLVEANKLQGPETATTVVLESGTSTLVDRPLLEAKEAIGGYAIAEVEDLDAALALARSFPMPDGKLEVRPVDQM